MRQLDGCVEVHNLVCSGGRILYGKGADAADLDFSESKVAESSASGTVAYRKYGAVFTMSVNCLTAP